MVSNELIVAGTTIALVGSAPILFGFGTVGVAASSGAAALQSSIGCVQAGSWFATLTSLGMKGVYVNTTMAGATTGFVGIVPKAKNLIGKLFKQFKREPKL